MSRVLWRGLWAAGPKRARSQSRPVPGPLRGSHLLGQCPAVARGLSFYLSYPLERPKGPGSQWPGLGLWRAAAAAVGSHAAPGPLVGPWPLHLFLADGVLSSL